MPDRAQGGSAGAAVVTGNKDDVGFCFCDACGDGAYAGFGDQLDADAGAAVSIFQVEDQLCEVFDGIDIVVRRRGDQSDAGCGVSDPSDPFIHLMAGQLAAFAGFGALGHLDLELVGHGQIVAGDAEAGGGHLLDGGAHGITVWQRFVAQLVFAAFTGIALSAEAVHRDGEGGVGFVGDRAEGHGAGGESFIDVFGRFHFVKGMLGRLRLKVSRLLSVAAFSLWSLTSFEYFLNVS